MEGNSRENERDSPSSWSTFQILSNFNTHTVNAHPHGRLPPRGMHEWFFAHLYKGLLPVYGTFWQRVNSHTYSRLCRRWNGDPSIPTFGPLKFGMSHFSPLEVLSYQFLFSWLLISSLLVNPCQSRGLDLLVQGIRAWCEASVGQTLTKTTTLSHICQGSYVSLILGKGSYFTPLTFIYQVKWKKLGQVLSSRPIII